MKIQVVVFRIVTKFRPQSEDGGSLVLQNNNTEDHNLHVVMNIIKVD
jgi:hypothetical protein